MKTEENPFFQSFGTPFETADFDKIKNEHFKPAYLKGIEVHDEEIAAIVSNPAAPDFENTLAALDRCGFKVDEGVNSLGMDISPHADLASSVAFRLAPVLKKSPVAIAGEVHRALSEERSYVDRVELAGPYLNFFMNQK
ncbi:MAG: hypothetical protein HGA23_03450, partial [Bacteroidales bacterium]|nr:hypothetical protein [Bacteroidales bacterium]